MKEARLNCNRASASDVMHLRLTVKFLSSSLRCVAHSPEPYLASVVTGPFQVSTFTRQTPSPPRFQTKR
jgi:hypothetical protein